MAGSNDGPWGMMPPPPRVPHNPYQRKKGDGRTFWPLKIDDDWFVHWLKLCERCGREFYFAIAYGRKPNRYECFACSPPKPDTRRYFGRRSPTDTPERRRRREAREAAEEARKTARMEEVKRRRRAKVEYHERRKEGKAA